MKKAKNLLAVVLAIMVAMAFGSISAFAQTVGTDAEGTGSITINNAAKGEEYKVVKVFDASIASTATDAGITYQGTIPEALQSVFEKDATGNIHVKEGKSDADVTNAVAAWAKTQAATASTTSDGTTLTFQGLAYGYYAVISSQGATVTIDSTHPNATVNDKNSKTITAKKEVEKQSYSIGDTIKYTATFDTVNFYQDGNKSKQVLNYTITDTLPDFISDVEITKITITKKDGTTDTTFTDKSFNADGEVVIDWAEEVAGTSNPKKWTSLYDNGAKIVVEYQGKLTSDTNINADDTNTVKIQPQVVKDDGTPDDEKPWDENWEKDAKIQTYAAALKKTDGSKALAGAKFTAKGLTVTKTSDGVYTVVSYDPNGTTDSVEMETDDKGMLYIVGLADGVTLSLTETKAPAGYNKTDDPISMPSQKVSEKIIKESGTIKYDAKGNVISSTSTQEAKTTVDETQNLNKLDAGAVTVVNNKGAELPETGGIGTTIFYILGALLIAVCGVVLIARRRIAAK